MNEMVRDSLSEKKKIKDLFMIVIKSIDISQNRKLVSSLIQFASNLCYGTGKFRTMLKTENTSNFFSTIRQILASNEIEEKDDKIVKADKVLLKHATLAFIGNLCVDAQLRATLAMNSEQILETVYL